MPYLKLQSHILTPSCTTHPEPHHVSGRGKKNITKMMGRKIFSTSSVTTTWKLWSTWKWSQKSVQPWEWALTLAQSTMDDGDSIPWEAAVPSSSARTSQCGCTSDRNPLSVATNPPRELLAESSPETEPLTIKKEFVRSTQDESPSNGEWLLIIA